MGILSHLEPLQTPCSLQSLAGLCLSSVLAHCPWLMSEFQTNNRTHEVGPSIIKIKLLNHSIIMGNFRDKQSKPYCFMWFTKVCQHTCLQWLHNLSDNLYSLQGQNSTKERWEVGLQYLQFISLYFYLNLTNSQPIMVVVYNGTPSCNIAYRKNS